MIFGSGDDDNTPLYCSGCILLKNQLANAEALSELRKKSYNELAEQADRIVVVLKATTEKLVGVSEQRDNLIIELATVKKMNQQQIDTVGRILEERDDIRKELERVKFMLRLRCEPAANNFREEFYAATRVVEAVRSMKAEALTLERWYTFVTCKFGEAVDEALESYDTVKKEGGDPK